MLRKGIKPLFKRFQCFALSFKLSLQNMSFFSNSDVIGIASMKSRKYIEEDICPIKINGSSTGWLPIQVKTIKIVVRDQKSVCDAGRKVLAWFLEVCSRGTKNKTRIDANKAITPPNFFGIERRMA